VQVERHVEAETVEQSRGHIDVAEQFAVRAAAVDAAGWPAHQQRHLQPWVVEGAFCPRHRGPVVSREDDPRAVVKAQLPQPEQNASHAAVHDADRTLEGGEVLPSLGEIRQIRRNRDAMTVVGHGTAEVVWTVRLLEAAYVIQ
jgi:hypothetical protein